MRLSVFFTLFCCTFICLFAVTATSHARDYDSWLSVRVVNNNNLLKGAGEQERFRYTVLNYAKRLQVRFPCDPRSAVGQFPFNATQTSWRRRCKANHPPAPTNRQFRTRWNPVKHVFDDDYLLGVPGRLRRIKLNLKIPGSKSFTLADRYDCDWEVQQLGSNVRTFRREDCKAFYPTVQLSKPYRARATVYRYRMLNRTDVLEHESPWFDFNVEDHIVVAMGDSFGSGEGNPHTFTPKGNSQTVSGSKRPPMWLDPRCHRSLFSSSGLATNVLAEKYKADSFSLVNLACSGAESGAGLTKDYTGRASASQAARSWRTLAGGTSAPSSRAKPQEGFHNYIGPQVRPISSIQNENKKSRPAPYDLPAQTEQLAMALNCENGSCERLPSAIMLYIGVNDIGFSSRIIDVILNCADDPECVAGTETGIRVGLAKVQRNLDIFEERLETMGIPETTPIYLVKYPNPLRHRIGSRLVFCNSENKRGEVRRYRRSGEGAFLGSLAGAFGFIIDPAGARFAEDKILEPLNQMLADAAESRSSWNVLDRTEEMADFGFCASNRMFNRYWDSVDKQGYIEKNYFWKDHNCRSGNCEKYQQFSLPTGAMHPNYVGHREIAVGIIEVMEGIGKFKRAR